MGTWPSGQEIRRIRTSPEILDRSVSSIWTATTRLGSDKENGLDWAIAKNVTNMLYCNFDKVVIIFIKQLECLFELCNFLF